MNSFRSSVSARMLFKAAYAAMSASGRNPPPSPRPDKRPHILRQFMPVFVADIHHMARVIIMILDAVLRDAGARQRIFGGEKRRREIIIALRDQEFESALLAARLPENRKTVGLVKAVAVS